MHVTNGEISLKLNDKHNHMTSNEKKKICMPIRVLEILIDFTKITYVNETNAISIF